MHKKSTGTVFSEEQILGLYRDLELATEEDRAHFLPYQELTGPETHDGGYYYFELSCTSVPLSMMD
ncbi:MAG: hypothetical protein HYV27_01405 [Candidatus Hydrogenedentes bacterium]|nr:hypothetical protein [Candidatus Hydrogenedentota bacterium]